jgi:hypothetical protein
LEAHHRADYTVYCGGWDVGRIYENRGGPGNLRWFWSMTVNHGNPELLQMATNSLRDRTTPCRPSALRAPAEPAPPSREMERGCVLRNCAFVSERACGNNRMGVATEIFDAGQGLAASNG